MKKILLNTSRIVSSLLLFAVLLSTLSSLFERKTSYAHYKDFFENPEEYDVLFFGTSHMLDAVDPMYLFENYGIPSYNIATPGCRIATSYWTLVGSLKYSKPKLVVLDVYGIEKDEKYNVDAKENMHMTFDEFPLSVTKYNALSDIFDGDDSKNKWEFLFPFIIYHSRWNSLEKTDFIKPEPYAKGASIVRGVVPETNPIPVVDAQRTTLDENISTEYFVRFIELCKSEGIEVLLTNMSYGSNEYMQRFQNKAYAYAEKYDINYIDFLRMEQVIDPKTDFATVGINTHLNTSGAKKITDYLGEYIMREYGLSDKRDDEKYSHWHNEYERYIDYKVEDLIAENALYNTLSSLRDKDFSYYIFIRDGSELYSDNTFNSLIRNIPQDPSVKLNVFFRALAKKQRYFLYYNPSSGELVESLPEDIDINKKHGQIYLKWSQTASNTKITTRKNRFNPYISNGKLQDICIIVYSKKTNEPIFIKQFAYQAQTSPTGMATKCTTNTEFE